MIAENENIDTADMKDFPATLEANTFRVVVVCGLIFTAGLCWLVVQVWGQNKYEFNRGIISKTKHNAGVSLS